MHLLPTNLAPLAELAAKDEGKYAMRGVHVRVHGDGTYRAAATDGKRLLVVSGPVVAEPTGFPDGPIQSAPNGEIEAIVPAPAWAKAFKTAAKLTGKRQLSHRPDLRSVAVAVGKNVTSFAATDLDQTAFDQPKNVEGKFPPYMDVIPRAEKARASFRVDPELMASTLKAMAEFTDDVTPGVDVELHRGKLCLRAEGNGQQLVGIVVPLELEVKGGGPVKDDAGDSAEVARLSARVAELEAEVSALRADRDRLKAAGRRSRGPVVAEGTARLLSRRERLGLAV